MREYAPGIESSELSLVDVPKAPVNAAGPTGRVDVSKTSADTAGPITFAPTSGGTGPMSAGSAASAERYLARAAEEHAAGHIDKTLWERAVAQAGGDDARAKSIYLLSRATAIRVAKRKAKEAKRAAVVEALSNGPDTGFSVAAPEAKAALAANDSRKARLASTKQKRRRAMLVAGLLGFLLVILGVLVAALWDSAPDPQNKLTGPVQRRSVFTRAAPPVTPAPAEVKQALPSGEAFTARVRELEKAGNWNVVVLYAVEWTRKQPGNPEAWKELSQGYVKMRQYAEAVDAANKAVHLDPDNFVLWQNLGQINIAAQAPTEALAAFHQAAVLNERDVSSLVQEGIINTQLGRMADAKIAFAKALAVNPDDIQALCGSATIAQKEGRAKDADAFMRQVKSQGERCRDASDGESVRVAGR